jgi:phospholipid/cholesterol/gamma-HCH transport system permease protein
MSEPSQAPRSRAVARRCADGVARLGARALAALQLPRATAQVLRAASAGVLARLTGRSRHRRGDVLEQLVAQGYQSIVFVVVTLGFLGMVMAYQACLQLSRITGDTSQVGSQFLRLVVSDLGATITGMMLATRVGAGIAAELGSMKVTEQLDALRLCGVSPIEYLVVPRLLACALAALALSVLGAAAMFGAAGLTAQLSFAVNPRVFFDASAVTGSHVVVGLLKAGSYGVAIPVVASACGLSARGSSEGVGWATTTAVIGGSLAVLVLDFAWSTGAYLVLGGRL